MASTCWVPFYGPAACVGLGIALGDAKGKRNDHDRKKNDSYSKYLDEKNKKESVQKNINTYEKWLAKKEAYILELNNQKNSFVEMRDNFKVIFSDEQGPYS